MTLPPAAFFASGALPSRARVLFLVGREELEIREVDLPRPGPGELLVAIEAATTCGTDLKVWGRGGHPRMLAVPGPFGHEMTGRIAAIGGSSARRAGAEPGEDPGRFREGDAVIVANSSSCGGCPACRAGRENLCPGLVYLNGAYADYVLLPEPFVERSTYLRPAGLAPELAAMAEPLACVEHGLARLGLAAASGPGSSTGGSKSVLVQGAGPLGLLFLTRRASRSRRNSAPGRRSPSSVPGTTGASPSNASSRSPSTPPARFPAGRPRSARPSPAAARSSSAAAPPPIASRSRPSRCTTTSLRSSVATTTLRAASARRSPGWPRRAPTTACCCRTKTAWRASERPCGRCGSGGR
jgi:hypothetical protein